MQVQVVENWADVQGRIVELKAHPTLSGYWMARIAVDGVSPVAGFPNLFEWAKGQTIEVNIPAVRAQELSLTTGQTVSGRVRKGGPTSAFVAPETLVTR